MQQHPSSAGLQQSDDIAQAANAVSLIGNVTQQNTSLAGETAAPAMNMRNQAHEMTRSDAAFQLDAGPRLSHA